jgi:hypothetical protein
MRRDGLKLRLSDPSPSASFHTSDSDDESSERGSRSGADDCPLPTAVHSAKVLSLTRRELDRSSFIAPHFQRLANEEFYRKSHLLDGLYSLFTDSMCDHHFHA